VRKGELKICYWNIAGLFKKCEETWDYLEKFHILGLTETLVDEQKWKKMKNRLVGMRTRKEGEKQKGKSKRRNYNSS